VRKKLFYLIIMFFGFLSVISAADQIYFDLTGGINFYPVIGGKIGWIHYWNNEKIGLITEISYFNNGFVHEPEGNWIEETKEAHNIGIGAGILFNNMGMNGIIRTMEYIKIKGILHLWGDPVFYPWLDLGFKLNVFFKDTTSISAGVGIELTWLSFPHIYFTLGMLFTL